MLSQFHMFHMTIHLGPVHVRMVYAAVPAALDAAVRLANVSLDHGFLVVKPLDIFHLPHARARPEPKDLRERFPGHVRLASFQQQRVRCRDAPEGKSEPRRDAPEGEPVTEDDTLVIMPPQTVTVLDNNNLDFPQHNVVQVREIPSSRNASHAFTRIRLLQPSGQSVRRRRVDVVVEWAPKGEYGPRTWLWLVSTQAVNESQSRLRLDERTASIWRKNLDRENLQKLDTFIDTITKPHVQSMIDQQLARPEYMY